LNLLLSELNIAYFKNETVDSVNTNCQVVEFKLMVETHLTEQTPISNCRKTGFNYQQLISTRKKNIQATSPKDFVTNRLMIEARRKLRYSNLS